MGKEKEEDLKFDADSKLRVTMQKTLNRKRYSIAHVFKPITDEQYFEFCKRKKVVQKLSGTDNVQLTSEDQNLQAVSWLWNQNIIKREGYKEPKNWREKVSLQEQNVAIEGLLIVEIDKDDDEIIDADPDELIDPAQTIGEVVILRCLHQGELLNIRHYFRTPSAKDVEEFNRITKRSMSIAARIGGLLKTKQSAEIHVIPQAQALAKLYDSLIEKTEGYKGRVPAYHKEITVSEVFANEVEAREKN